MYQVALSNFIFQMRPIRYQVAVVAAVAILSRFLMLQTNAADAAPIVVM